MFRFLPPPRFEPVTKSSDYRHAPWKRLIRLTSIVLYIHCISFPNTRPLLFHHMYPLHTAITQFYELIIPPHYSLYGLNYDTRCTLARDLLLIVASFSFKFDIPCVLWYAFIILLDDTCHILGKNDCKWLRMIANDCEWLRMIANDCE